MKEENKKKSINYWNKHASHWSGIAYDKNQKYLNFPSSGQREEITISEIEKFAKSKRESILDIGCADGELVISLLKRGFVNIMGIDNSREMIKFAKKRLKKEISKNTSETFFVSDADNLMKNKEFDFVTAMGLIEYLLNLNVFFDKLAGILKPGGRAFIESRNELFNLFSANNYTVKSNIPKLIDSLEDVKKLSPIQDKKEIEKVVIKTFIAIGEEMKKFKPMINKPKVFDNYPFKLPQATPKDIEKFCRKHKLELEYVIYYHPHPFLPGFADVFPQTFNKIALLMQPLGYTPLGAVFCSSFIAVIKK